MRKFNLGTLMVTNGIAERMQNDSTFQDFLRKSLDLYITCDWGTLDEADKRLNDAAVKNSDARIFAAYIYPDTDEKIWIITEWDRSVTTILFPYEY